MVGRERGGAGGRGGGGEGRGGGGRRTRERQTTGGRDQPLKSRGQDRSEGRDRKEGKKKKKKKGKHPHSTPRSRVEGARLTGEWLLVTPPVDGMVWQQQHVWRVSQGPVLGEGTAIPGATAHAR